MAHTATSTADIQTLRPGTWIQGHGFGRFAIRRAVLPIPNLPAALRGLRVAHLSDLHARRYWSPTYDELIAHMAANPPDLICLTGDCVDDKRNHRPGWPILQRLLPALSSRLGTFAILGNHDRAGLIPHLHELKPHGLHLLHGERRLVPWNGGQIELIGLPGPLRKHLRPQFVASIPPKPADAVRIILSHFPDQLRRVGSLRPDLVLAGHTHGGQICLPGGWPIIRHDSLPARLCGGIHRVNDTWLAVSRGFGFAAVQIRLFCPAEVVEIVLEREEGMSAK